MSSRKPVRRRKVQQKNKTNWGLIGGVVITVSLLFLGMAFFSNRGKVETTDLASYCDENPNRCLDWGAKDAPVTVVEVSDYGCPHCRTFNEDTAPLIYNEYIEAGQVRWITVPFALGIQTIAAANAALCGRDLDQVRTLHESLFVLQESATRFSDDGIINVAGSVGISTSDFSSCVEDGKYNRVIEQNISAAQSVGVNSTPTFFVNGEELRGAQPITAFESRINSLLQ